MKTLLRASALTAIGILACGCGSSSSSDGLLINSVPQHLTVASRSIGGFGSVLTDASGHALYMFPPDASQRVTCTGPCAGTWPPLTVAAGSTPAAGPGVDARRLATLPDPNSGARIVTYAGFPLYRYAGDTSAGTANGQALFIDGGPWYLLTPAGTPLTSGPGGAP